jgi:hypothetical protein
MVERINIHLNKINNKFMKNLGADLIASHIENVQPNIFHIHIDSKQPLKPELWEKAVEIGFTDTNFSGHIEGHVHFEPVHHMTLKIDTKEVFSEKWQQIVEISDSIGFEGYLEGEFIPFDTLICYKNYNPNARLPFQIKRRVLTEEEGFRGSEIHVSFLAATAEQAVVDTLMDAGLYGALIPKRLGDYLVLTVQGSVRQIQEIYEPLKKYLEEVGGLQFVTIKEERAIKYKTYGLLEAKDLPEVIDTIVWL